LLAKNQEFERIAHCISWSGRQKPQLRWVYTLLLLLLLLTTRVQLPIALQLLIQASVSLTCHA
jgi:hypothetical protein